MRLKTSVKAAALLRYAEQSGGFGVVLHKGDPDGGVLFAQFRRGREMCLYQERGGRFEARTEGWVPEFDAAEIVRRERDFDRDLWLVEIEGPDAETLLSALEF